MSLYDEFQVEYQRVKIKIGEEFESLFKKLHTESLWTADAVLYGIEKFWDTMHRLPVNVAELSSFYDALPILEQFANVDNPSRWPSSTQRIDPQLLKSYDHDGIGDA